MDSLPPTDQSQELRAINAQLAALREELYHRPRPAGFGRITLGVFSGLMLWTAFMFAVLCVMFYLSLLGMARGAKAWAEQKTEELRREHPEAFNPDGSLKSDDPKEPKSKAPDWFKPYPKEGKEAAKQAPDPDAPKPGPTPPR